ncbi:MAG: TonB-dependent receptor [Bacteroidetes bacterium]|nr:TonB-dependent receptor [Bacteroidota bacterium]
MKYLLSLPIFFALSFLNAQSGIVKGTISNATNNKPIEFAKIQVIDQQKGATSLDNGSYEISGLKPGVYSFKASASGFKDLIMNEITVTNARSVELDFPMEEIIKEKSEVTVKAAPFTRKVESPVSLKTLNSTEIERLPGANRDVSKVIAALPGVASRATFRNDIIIRGGSPGENKFYLDGIEVPNINHFATQGSSGGPVGLLNVNFIREVDFYSGAFPSNRANALSSVLAFKQKDGNPDALITNFALGSSDAALTFDGPLSKKADFIFSVRRSYLQFLFAALKLPFLPTYNDFQYKVNYKINTKNKISFIGLGALDQFKLNAKVNESIDMSDSTTRDFNNYIINNLPIQNQWNYTIGVNYSHFSKHSIQNVVVSRNMLNNRAYRYRGLVEVADSLLQDYSSFEAENKLRFEHTYNKNGWRVNAGVGYEYARYYNSTYNNITVQGSPVLIDFSSNLFMSKFAVFGQVNRSLMDERINLSLGLRSDVNNYSKLMMNPLDQLSPSLSASYRITPQWAINANIARYHQLPSYTILGYRNASGELANKDFAKYIRADHYVLGGEYLTKTNSRFTLEGFYKKYDRYPFSVKDSLCLANIGSDFGVVGNEEIRSTSQGRSYGLEFLYQQKLFKGFYAVLAYTYVRSEFQDKNSVYVPTAWDSRNIISLTGGKRFKKGWEVGFRWLYSGGSPYTPTDVANSALIQNWEINGFAFPDYSQLNTQRESSFHQLNIRVDKKIFLEKFSLNFYLDVQNAYGYKAILAPIYLAVTDASGNFVVDPNDSSRYLLKEVKNASGIVQPTIGIIVEFAAKKTKK